MHPPNLIMAIGSSLAIALAGAGCGSSALSSSSASGRTTATGTTATAGGTTGQSGLASLGALISPGPPGPIGPEGIPIPAVPALAERAAKPSTTPIDGIQCLGSEQTVFHIHAHLTLFLGGAARQIPGGIGIVDPQIQTTQDGPFVAGGRCFFWLHTHAADGLIHIESPVQRTFTLGNFFDVWGQPLGPNRVGPASGKVTAIVDGKLYAGDPRSIPLAAFGQIQLEVGAPLVAPTTISSRPGSEHRRPGASGEREIRAWRARRSRQRVVNPRISWAASSGTSSGGQWPIPSSSIQSAWGSHSVRKRTAAAGQGRSLSAVPQTIRTRQSIRSASSSG